MHLFFHPEEPVQDIIVPFDEEMRHLRALRIREDELVLCTNGKGWVHTCKVITEKKTSSFQIISSEFFPEKSPRFILAVAPTKNQDRMEWLIEKAVEIGISTFIPIICEHSEKAFLKLDRLERVAIAAMKQSRKSYLPEIKEPTDFHFILEENAPQKYIAHCALDLQKKPLIQVLKPNQDTLICIGPEGDFSEKEITKATLLGFTSVSLGDERLRTETAGMVATTIFQMKQYT